MKKIFLIITVICVLLSAVLFTGCGDKPVDNPQDGGTSQTEPDSGDDGSEGEDGEVEKKDVDYTVEYYTEELDGSFKLEKSEVKKAKQGDTVTASAEAKEGFTHDAKDEKNVLSGVAAENNGTVLKVYYNRNQYTLTKQGASAATVSVKFGETVELETIENAVWQLVSGNAVLDGNRLTIGTEDVVVKSVKQIAEYTAEYYFEGLDGKFVVDETMTIKAEGKVNSEISAEIPEKVGFTFDRDNANNKVSVKLSEDGANLSVYYKRNVYTVTVSGSDTALQGKYGETILLEEKAGYYWVLKEGDGTLNGNKLSMGTTNITLESVQLQQTVLNNSIYTENFGGVSVRFNGNNNASKQGVIFLYNDPQTFNVANGAQEYYFFYTNGGEKVTAYLAHIVNGTETIMAQQDITLADGEHTYSVDFAQDGIHCKIDGNEIVSDPYVSNFAGRVGLYVDSGRVDYSDFTVTSGEMSVERARQYAGHIMTTLFMSYYAATANGTVELKSDFMYAEAYGALSEETTAVRSKLESLTTVEEIVGYMLEFHSALQPKIAREAVWSTMYALAKDLTDALLVPYVGGEVTTVTAGDTGCVISSDIYAPDGRWYVPNAYMLVSGLGESFSKGLYSYMNDEILAVTSGSVADYTAIADRYVAEIVRAVCYHNIDFYYWYNYGIDPNSTFNMWWYLWTYLGDGSVALDYAGPVKGYSWNGQFRLCAALLNPKDGSYSTDANTIIGLYCWIRDYQTKNVANYNLLMNTNGGSGVEESYTVNNLQAFTLPVPQKNNAAFQGWYVNRNFYGDAISSVPAYNRRDLTLYAKWQDQVPSNFSVSELFGDNMLMPRNRAIAVNGTGEDGAEVSVSFNGTEKKTVVADGTWSVILDPMSANAVGQTMTITCGDTVLKFNNILIGEVWLCAGQSNMEARFSWFGLKNAGTYNVYNNYNYVRIFRQNVPLIEEPGDKTLCSRWLALNNESRVIDAYEQSAVALGFALQLQKNLGIPVGVVVSARGGTYIEEWLSQDSMKQTVSTVPQGMNIESRYYDCMTTALNGFPFAGVVWYQGENNYRNPQEYKAQFALLTGQYRSLFGNPSLPVIYMQLPQYLYDNWKDFRLMQWDLMNSIDNVYAVCTIDLGNPYDIHPADKLPLSQRAGDIAAKYGYGIQCRGISPYPLSCKAEGDTLVITFENCAQGFVAENNCVGFEVAGEDGVFRAVSGKASGNTVVLSGVSGVCQVRYLYGAVFPVVNLFTTDGLPAAPFSLTVA